MSAEDLKDNGNQTYHSNQNVIATIHHPFIWSSRESVVLLTPYRISNLLIAPKL